MQRLKSKELEDTRIYWSEHLANTAKSFDWAGRQTAENEALTLAITEQVNDSVYFTLAEDVAMYNDPLGTAERVTLAIDDLFDDDAFVNDCLGTDEVAADNLEVFNDFIHHINGSLCTFKGSAWKDLVKAAQESIELAATHTGATCWVSTLAIHSDECSVMLLGRDDLELDRRYIIKEEMTIQDHLTEAESADGSDYTFGTDRYVVFVNGSFAPSFEEYLSEEDVLTVYKVKRG
tara:strand:+ start:1425 stop:2126 length:702 start_codon:yes stop_codon:yes gene_type:complete